MLSNSDEIEDVEVGEERSCGSLARIACLDAKHDVWQTNAVQALGCFGLGWVSKVESFGGLEAVRSIKKSVVVVRRGLKSVLRDLVKERMPAARPSVTVQRRSEA